MIRADLQIKRISFKLIFKISFLVSILSFFSNHGVAQEMELKKGITGIWNSTGKNIDSAFSWKAQWIWLDKEFNNEVLLARKTFSLNQNPENAILRITASSKYQLYINGEYVCQGPARCAPHHQSYDIFDISDWLKKGGNLIAVRVHHQEGKFSYQYKQRAGLLVQINGLQDSDPISTDASWKVSNDPSWNPKAPKISRFQQVVNDRVDLNKQLRAWNKIEYDDSKWKQATALNRNDGWPAPQKDSKPQPLINPWTQLIPRDIPYLSESVVNVPTLLQAVPIELDYPIQISGNIDKSISKSWKNFKDKNKPFKIPVSTDGKTWFLLFDFGEVYSGMPVLDLKGSKGTVIEVLNAPFIVNNQFSYKVVDSEFLDQIILSGEREQWQSTYFKPTRYMGIVIRETDSPTEIYSAGIHQISYPFSEKGSIHSNDATWVKNYMDATAKTIKICTTDGYTDNYRERRQYAQTGYYAALGNYWLFGDNFLQRRYLIQVAQEQTADGMMPAYAPAAANDYMIIMDSNCLWIRSLRNYLLYSGDYNTVKELLPAAKKLMNLLNSYTNSLGMIDNPAYPYWLDHALNDRRGSNFNLNGHYLGALEDFADVLKWLDEPGSEIHLKRAHTLRQSLQTHLWDKEKQLFADALIDGELSKMFSEHANAMALSLNIATEEQANKIARQLLIEDNHNYIKRESGMVMVTPAMSYFLHKGLCNYGFIEESMNMFRKRFDKMLAPETNKTLWEEWRLDGIGRAGFLQKGRTRSDAQTESAFPPALFAEYLLGVNPTKPGMKEFDLKYTNSGLKNIEGKIPTPEGLLEIAWNIKGKNKVLKINIPGEIRIKLDLHTLVSQEKKQVVWNNQKISDKLSSSQYLELEKGNHEIQF